MRILKKFPALCDFCAAEKPTLVYDVPAGLPLWLERSTGMVVCSSGWVGACEGCRGIIDAGPARAGVLARRFVDLNPRVLEHPDNSREAVVAWREKLNAMLFKRITNLSSPGAYVPFEDPLEGKFVEID